QQEKEQFEEKDEGRLQAADAGSAFASLAQVGPEQQAGDDVPAVTVAQPVDGHHRRHRPQSAEGHGINKDGEHASLYLFASSSPSPESTAPSSHYRQGCVSRRR